MEKEPDNIGVLITAKDEQELLLVLRESQPWLSNVEVDVEQCDTILRIEVGGKTVVDIRPTRAK